VSSRAKAKKKAIVPSATSFVALILVVLVAGVPILGTILVTASTSEPDLSDLTPIHERAGKYLVLDWSALLQDRPRLPKTGTVIPAGADVQALGYMMNGERSVGKDKWVQDFVLLPEAGSLLHPPHRMPDQMIAVHLEHDNRIQFSPRALVWAWGSLHASAGLGPRSEALYTLERAHAKSAGKADIQRHFK